MSEMHTPQQHPQYDPELYRLDFESAEAEDRFGEMRKIAEAFREHAAAEKDSLGECAARLLGARTDLREEAFDQLSLDLDRIGSGFEAELNLSLPMKIQLLSQRLEVEVHFELFRHAEETIKQLKGTINEATDGGEKLLEDLEASDAALALFRYAEHLHDSGNSGEASAIADLAASISRGETCCDFFDREALLMFSADRLSELGFPERYRSRVEEILELHNYHDSLSPSEHAETQVRLAEAHFACGEHNEAVLLAKALQSELESREGVSQEIRFALGARLEFVRAEVDMERGEIERSQTRCENILQLIPSMSSVDTVVLTDQVLSRLIEICEATGELSQRAHYNEQRLEHAKSIPALQESALQCYLLRAEDAGDRGDAAGQLDALKQGYSIHVQSHYQISNASVALLTQLGQVLVEHSKTPDSVRTFAEKHISMIEKDRRPFVREGCRELHVVAIEAALRQIRDIEGDFGESLLENEIVEKAAEHIERALELSKPSINMVGPVELANTLMLKVEFLELREDNDAADRIRRDVMETLHGVPDEDCGAIRSRVFLQEANRYLDLGRLDAAENKFLDCLASFSADSTASAMEQSIFRVDLAELEWLLVEAYESAFKATEARGVAERIFDDLSEEYESLVGMNANLDESKMDCLKLLINAAKHLGESAERYQIALTILEQKEDNRP